MRATDARARGRICIDRRFHVAHSLDALDGFIEMLVLEYLAANDIGCGAARE